MKPDLHFFLLLFISALLLLVNPSTLYCATHNQPPGTMNHGGPDSYGYTWIDNHNEPLGPVYHWIDIAAPANNIHLYGDNGWASNIPIGFDFPFYGANRTNLYIEIDGEVLFINPVALNRWGVHGLSSDLIVDSTNNEGVYKWSNTDTAVVEWDARSNSNHLSTRFEVVLIRNGDIYLQYDQMTIPTADYSVELEAGLSYFLLTDSAYVADGSVIHIVYPGNSSAVTLSELPQKYSLAAYPNPFNSTTNLRIENVVPTIVLLNLYNANGQFLSSIIRGQLSAGVHSYPVNLSGYSSGRYYVRFGSEFDNRAVQLIFLK